MYSQVCIIFKHVKTYFYEIALFFEWQREEEKEDEVGRLCYFAWKVFLFAFDAPEGRFIYIYFLKTTSTSDWENKEPIILGWEFSIREFCIREINSDYFCANIANRAREKINNVNFHCPRQNSCQPARTTKCDKRASLEIT